MEIVEFQRPDGKNLNIEIIQNTLEHNPKQDIGQRHRHNFHSIFFIKEGKSKQEIDFERYEISKQEILIIPQGATHLIKEISAWEGYTIVFKDEFFSKVQKDLLNGFLQYAIITRKLLINIPKPIQNYLEYYFKLLFEEQNGKETQNQVFLLQNLMLALLNKLETLAYTSLDENFFIRKQATFQSFVSLLEDNFLTQKNLNFYIENLQITQRKLNDVLKEMVGLTAQDLIIERVILEAKRELCFSTKNIKEIAFLLGYDNQYYFSRIFKKRTEQSPEQFRSLSAQ